jgi:hypothetical protein
MREWLQFEFIPKKKYSNAIVNGDGNQLGQGGSNYTIREG